MGEVVGGGRAREPGRIHGPMREARDKWTDRDTVKAASDGAIQKLDGSGCGNEVPTGDP